MKKKAAVILLPIFLMMIFAGCGPRQTVAANLGNAENSLFTPDGRLFVTGHQIWEIQQGARGYPAVSLADYLRGTVLALAAFADPATAPVYETERDKFAGPTSCIIGQGLGFDAADLLVTEGGIVGIDPNSNFGNRLSVMRYQAGD